MARLGGPNARVEPAEEHEQVWRHGVREVGEVRVDAGRLVG